MTQEFFPDTLYQSVKLYKKRFYINLLLKGLILFLGVAISYFLIISLLEYYGWFSPTVRAVFLFSFIGIVGTTSYLFLIKPLYSFINADRLITDEKAAQDLGNIFPEVKDKLVNVLQLRKQSEANALAIASIKQKSLELKGVPFDRAIDLKENKKYLRYIIPVAFVAVLGAIFLPGLFTESPQRIASFTKIFPKPAPFSFHVLTKSLTAFRNEDFTVEFKVDGKELPERVQMVVDGQTLPVQTADNGNFTYTFPSIKEATSFQLEGAGFYSPVFDVEVIDKPLINNIEAKLIFPTYLGRKEELQKNVGNLTVPEGTKIVWDIKCLYTDKIHFSLSNQANPISLEAGLLSGFTYATVAKKSFDYKLSLLNAKAKGDGELQYSVNVVEDAMPKVQVVPAKDTSLFSYIILAGLIEDDYGFSALKVFYRVNKKGNASSSSYRNFPIPYSKNNTVQNFTLHWPVDSLKLQPGDKLEYFVKVWDNDGVNGPKAASSSAYAFELPSEKSVNEEIKNKQAETAQSLNNSFSQSKSISKQLDKLQNNLKNKKELNWQDRKNLEELLQKQNELKDKLQNLQKENEQNNEREEKFSEQNEQLAEKTQQLEELMKELLDDETLKMYEELQKLLAEKNNSPEIKNLLEKLENKQERFDKELERALEMFKQLKFEKDLDKTIKDLDQLTQEQDKLGEQATDEKNKTEDLQNKQEKLNEEFDKLKGDLKELEELNKSLKEPNEDFKPNEGLQKSIEEKQQNSSNQLQQGNRKGAQKQQKNAAGQMQDLAKELSSMAQSMQAEAVDENIQDLRYLLENLLALSFEQETLMKEFKKINQTDPRYIGLLQREMKLKDDAKLVEDSLFALGKRTFQLKKFVTKEVGDMNDYILESISSLKQRRPDISAGKQQFAMTSMNNLALMLSDVLKQLQQQQQMMSKPGGAQCKKPGKNNPGQSMSELQKALNKKIEALKGSGKEGKELSQELAKMIAEQQAIRKMVKEMEGKSGMDPRGKQQLKELSKKMEETERDLAFKQLSSQTLMRQNDIMTRLLESEKAQREREFEENRESKTGDTHLNRKYPPALEKYLKEKEKQIEMLKSTPPSLNPYYKEKVGQYFQKISQ